MTNFPIFWSAQVCVSVFFLHYYANICGIINLQFYFQNGRPAPSELKEQCLIRANQLFYGHADGLQIHGEIS